MPYAVAMKIPKDIQKQLQRSTAQYLIVRTSGGHYKVTNLSSGAFTFVSCSPRNKAMTERVVARDLRKIGLL